MCWAEPCWLDSHHLQQKGSNRQQDDFLSSKSLTTLCLSHSCYPVDTQAARHHAVHPCCSFVRELLLLGCVGARLLRRRCAADAAWRQAPQSIAWAPLALLAQPSCWLTHQHVSLVVPVLCMACLILHGVGVRADHLTHLRQQRSPATGGHAAAAGFWVTGCGLAKCH